MISENKNENGGNPFLVNILFHFFLLNLNYTFQLTMQFIKLINSRIIAQALIIII